jgi:hypothetical protein
MGILSFSQIHPFVLGALALLWASTALSAQGSWGVALPEPREMADNQTRWMMDSLNLSEAQAGHVARVNREYAEKWEETHRGEDHSDWSLLRESLAAHRREQDQALRIYLTTAQWTQYLAIRERLDQQRHRKARH